MGDAESEHFVEVPSIFLKEKNLEFVLTYGKLTTQVNRLIKTQSSTIGEKQWKTEEETQSSKN